MVSKQSKSSLRLLVLWASVFYLLALCGLLYGLDHCTEQQWYFGILIYLPAEGWLLPLVVLLPLALMVRPRICLLHVAAAVMLYCGYLRSPAPVAVPANASEPTLTVITANLGQRTSRSLQPFLDEQDADIIAFQERVYAPKAFLANNPDYDVKVEGEFTLASRLPINNSGIVPDLTFEGHPVAAWFELEYKKRAIVIYSVHMPTPRSYLQEMRYSGLFSGGGLLEGQAREDYQYYWSVRFELARGLLKVLEGEDRPMLMVGDFNTPAHGGVYKMLASQLADTFAVAGSGSGDTFPANTHGRLSELGPWLRLDYLFAGKGWRPLESTVEPLVTAQHLAVMGRYELLPAKPEPAKPVAGTVLAKNSKPSAKLSSVILPP